MKEEGRKYQPGFIFVLSYLNIRPLSPLEFAERVHEKLEGPIAEMLMAMDQEGLVIVPDKTIPMQLTELGRQLVSEFHPKHMT